jgi:hypothetical protein
MVLRCLFLLILATGCTPRLRYATEAEATATGIVMRIRHVNGQSGGEMSLHNTSPTPYFLTAPYHCSVYLFLYDAQHQILMPNRKVKRYCNPADAGPISLVSGDSIHYSLESPRNNHDDQELLKARYFEVIYQGNITPQRDAKRAQRFSQYTFKTTGSIE